MILFPQNIVVRRVTGSWVSGDWVTSEEKETLSLDVQFATGKELNSLPVDRKDSGAIHIFSDTALNVSREGGKSSGDLIEWENQLWEVIVEMPCKNNLMPHYEYLAYCKGVL